MMSAHRGLAVAVALLAIGCGDKGDDTASARVDDILALSGDEASGASVYTGSCSGCHGTNGEGLTGPAMADVVSDNSDEEIVSVVLSGTGSMPAFDSLADQDIADLLAYITNTF